MAKNGQGKKNNEKKVKKVNEHFERILRSVNKNLQRMKQKRLTKCPFFFGGLFFPYLSFNMFVFVKKMDLNILRL